MPTKAQLEEELDALKRSFAFEMHRNQLLREQVQFIQKLPSHETLAVLSQSLAKMGHALRKTIEVEKTGKSTSF